MKKIQLLMISMMVALCVSATVQDVKAQDEKKDFAKAAKALHNVWVGNADKTAAEIKKMKDLDLGEDMIEMVLERVGTMEVTFEKERFTAAFGDQEMKGKWNVKSHKQNDKSNILVIHTVTDEDFGGREKNFEVHVGKGTIKMIDLDEGGLPIVLERKKDDKKKDDKKNK